MKFFKVRLNISIFISLLIIVIVISYSLLAINKFYIYKKNVSKKLELTLDRFHFLLRNEIKKDILKIISPKPLSDKESALKTFRLTVKPKDIDSLNVNLPTSGKNHYVDAYMSISDKKNKIYKIKLRYRGDQINHWYFESKSLRIKLAKNDVYMMQKKFNLINPPMISTVIDVINYKKARKLGLISPDFYPVRVFINGKYMGVSYFLSQIDESLMRAYKRMPGSIYRGDNNKFNKADKHGVSNLFRNEKVWEKVASRNSEQKANREDIQYFISSINGLDDIGFYKFFRSYLDNNKYYKFFALDVIFGSNHHDYGHNHYLYFDPYKGKYEPIEWDLRYWGARDSKDISVYPLLNRVILNPVLEAERDKAVYNLLVKPEFDIDNIASELSGINGNIKKDLISDYLKNRAGTVFSARFANMWYSTPYTMNEYRRSMAQLKKTLARRRKNLISIYENTQVTVNLTHRNKLSILKVAVGGNSPVKIRVDKDIFRDVNFNGVVDAEDIKVVDEDILYPGRKWTNGSLFNRSIRQYGYRHLIASTLSYQYISKKQDIKLSDLNITNYITGTTVRAKEGGGEDDSLTSSVHPWDLPISKHKIKVLEGDIVLNETIVFNKNTSVIIKPNTTFRLNENVSIYFYGKVSALGTKEQPIRFIAKKSDKPWGVVAVQGKAATGSQFKYVEFVNGSIDTHNLIHYTSPFNIHDMDWFEVRHCKIGRNFVGDDAMHIAYAKGVVDNSEFINARSDGLDIDISDVTITNNIFYNSGNDGLDIMTTTMNASNNIFIDMGDKGISVGEWSEANITDSFFLSAVIGIEIKDKSNVSANNLIIVDSSEKAINLYNKNKRYDGGGFLDAETIYLLGNTKVKSDKLSGQQIKHRVKNILPSLNQYNWHERLKNSPYKKFLDEVEQVYAQ